MAKNKNTVKVRCLQCNQNFLLWKTSVEEIEVKRGFKNYLLAYYQCPLCEAYFVVMVQDDQALETGKAYQASIDKIKACVKARKTPSTTLIKKTKEMEGKFKRQTTKLSFEFPSVFYQFDELKLENENKVTDTIIGEEEKENV